MPKAARVASRSSSPATYPASSARRASRPSTSRPRRSARSRSSATTACRRAIDEARVGRASPRALASSPRASASAALELAAERDGERARRRRARGRRRPRPARRRAVAVDDRRRGRGRRARSPCARRCAASAPPETASSSGARGPRPASWRMRPQLGDQPRSRPSRRAPPRVLGDRPAPGTATASAARARPGRYGQISSVTNGITGCSSASDALQHVQRGLRRLPPRHDVVAVEADLERLEIPVADVVPDEAVQLLDEVRELERLVLRRRRLRVASFSRVRIQRSIGSAPRRRRDAPRGRRPAAPAARRSRACSRTRGPRRSRSAKRTSCVEHIFSRP